ncbi:MAG: GNAT family N-acetyltransferase [Bacteroidales bacterium]|nr:GNAT family N-acetyltransferase [Bacteroidales bacterium]
MLKFKIFNPENGPDSNQTTHIVDFLFEHLQEFGDSKSDIEKCVDYAVKKSPSFGGFVLVGYLEEVIAGIVIINQTGMKGYIPENILVYIATHKDHRGKGLGKQLMKKAIEMADGDVALHVEPNNPARFLYEKLGFASKYLEMRYKAEDISNK